LCAAEPDPIAVDGETSRRSCARSKCRLPLHTVSAWATRQRLGPVDKPDPETNAPKQDEAEKAGCSFIVSGIDPLLFFEMAN
jgi:hypothetical protein